MVEPPWIAAKNGHENVIRALAKLGANLNTPNENGATPLDIAYQEGYEEIIESLKERGLTLS